MQFEDLQVGDKIIVVAQVRDIYPTARKFLIGPYHGGDCTNFTESDIVTWPDRKAMLLEKAETLSKELADIQSQISAIDDAGKISAAFDKNYVPEVRDVLMSLLNTRVTIEAVELNKRIFIRCDSDGSTGWWEWDKLCDFTLVSRGEPVAGDQCEITGDIKKFHWFDERSGEYHFYDTLFVGKIRSDFRIIASAEVKA